MNIDKMIVDMEVFCHFLTLFFQSRVIGLFPILMRSCSQIFIKFGWGLPTWIHKLGQIFICFALFSLFLALMILIFDIFLGYALDFCFPIWFCFSVLEKLSFTKANPIQLSNCAILAVSDPIWPWFAPVCPPLMTRDRSHCLIAELVAWVYCLCKLRCFRCLLKLCLMHGPVMWPYWWFECMEHAVLEALGTRVKSVSTTLGGWHLLTKFA